MLLSKKIIIVSQDSKVSKFFPSECQMEIVSSINFLDTGIFGFAPDLIVVDSIYDVDILKIRKNENLSFVPVLILSDNLSMIKKFSDIVFCPRVMICSKFVLENDKIKKRIIQIIESKKSFLPPKTSSIAKKSLKFIEEHFGENLTRESIAKNVECNVDYLSRIFKKEMGLKLWDYVLEIRLAEAKILLERTGLNVQDISSKTGFNDLSYFDRAFKNRFSKSPKEIREEK